MLNTGGTLGDRFFARLLDDHLVVIDLARREMRVLNPTAAFLWLSLSLGPCSPDTLVRLVADQTGAAVSDQIGSDIAACLDDWRDLGWLGGDDAGQVFLVDHAGDTASADIVTWVPTDDPVASMVPQVETVICSVRLLHGGATVRLGSVADPVDCDLVPRLRALLSGFPASEPGSAATHADISFIVDTDRIWVQTPAGLAWTDVSSDALSHLVYSLLLAADPGRRPLATLHAAAVGQLGRGLVLMPGLSGCGKSTLTAALVAKGWSYGGDDVIALSETEPQTVLPFPTASSVKPGSWNILSGDYPQIADLPVIPYADKQARFLPLPVAAHVGDGIADRVPVALVFPRFDPAGSNRLEPISTLDAVLRLVVSGFTTGDRLEPQRLDRLFDLLEGLPKYHLVFASTEAAAAALAPLVA